MHLNYYKGVCECPRIWPMVAGYPPTRCGACKTVPIYAGPWPEGKSMDEVNA